MAKALEKLKSLLDEGEPVDMCPHGTSELMCDQCDTLNYYALCEKAGCSHKEGHKCGKENWVSLVQTNEKAGITFDGDVDHLKRDELDPVADSKQVTLYVKMPFQKIVCKNCVYWETMGTHGLCRRYAPKETKIPWPTTVATDWCGEGRE